MSLLIELPDSSAAPAREEQRKPLKRARDHEQNLLALAPQVAREQPLHGAVCIINRTQVRLEPESTKKGPRSHPAVVTQVCD